MSRIQNVGQRVLMPLQKTRVIVLLATHLTCTGRTRSCTTTLITALGSVFIHHSLSRVASDSAHSLGPRSNRLSMHRAGYAVVKFDVELGQFVLADNAGLIEIAKRGLVDNVANGEAFDGLILGRLGSTAVTHDETGVITTVAIAAVVTALHCHL